MEDKKDNQKFMSMPITPQLTHEVVTHVTLEI
jgi:hypothetical protein